MEFQNFQKQKIDLKSDTAIISLRLEGWYFLTQNA